MMLNNISTPDLANVLKISPDIQIDLLKKFVERTTTCSKNVMGLLSFESILAIREEMLDDVLAKVEELLETDACSVYLNDSSEQATLRAARGYQKPKIDKAVRKIIPAANVIDKPTECERLGLTSWVISTGHSFLATSPNDFLDHPHWSGSFDKHMGDEIVYEKQKQIAAFLAIPLRDSRGQVIGALKAQKFAPSNPFSVENQITLEALGQVAGRCSTYVNDAGDGPVDAAITSWALKIFSDASTTEGELDAFLDIAVRVCAAVAQADACSVFLVDESRRTLTQRAGCGHQGLKNIIRSYSLPDRSVLVGCVDFETCSPSTCRNKPGKPFPEVERVGITAWVAATGKSFYANSKEELRQHCHHKGQFDPQNFEQTENSEIQKINSSYQSVYREECSAWFGTPLVVGGTPIGVLKIENKTLIGKPDPRQFSAEVKQRIEILAQDIGISIRRLQIQGKTRYEVINKAMPTILTILQGGLNIHQLVERVVVETAHLFNARACALFLKEGDKLIQPKWAAYGYASQTGGQVETDREQKIDRLREYKLVPEVSILTDPPQDKKVGLTVWIAVTKTKFSARSNQELKLHPHHIGRYDPVNFSEKERCESFMGAPLLVGEKKDLIGVLKVETKQRKIGNKTDYSYFNEQDSLVFDLISNSVAIAIQNARLLESRRLADGLLNQPNRYATLREAFIFIEDRVDVVNTLDGAAKYVAEKDTRKARVIESVIGILKPDFNESLLELFAYLISDSNDPLYISLANLIRLCQKMIEVKIWSDIYTIKVVDYQSREWDNTEFILEKFVQKLLDVHREVSTFLKMYDRDKYFILALKNCLNLLNAQLNEIESQNLFTRNVLHKIFDTWRHLIEMEFSQQHEIKNPYIAGMPLDANSSSVFFGREEIFQWIEDHLHEEKGILIIHGGWHIGKTSILKQIQDGSMGESIRERDSILPVFVDLQRMADPGINMFLQNIKERICKALQKYKMPLPEIVHDFNVNPYYTFDRFLDQVNLIIHEHGKQFLLIMLDEFELLYKRVETNKLDPEIFQYLRSLMQHESRLSFILAGHHPLDEMPLDIRTPIFNVAYHKEIGFLDFESAKRLIVEPVRPYAVEYHEKCIGRILKLTAGHPFFIQKLCRNCIDVMNSRKEGYLVTMDVLDTALQLALSNDVTLTNLWDVELDPKDRGIIGRLAEMIDRDDEWIKESDLIIQTKTTVQELVQSLQKPIIKKLITYRKLTDDTEYAFGVDILRLWIKDQIASQ